MGRKSTTVEFDRDGYFNAERVFPKTTRIIQSVTYENGTVHTTDAQGFDTTIYNVDVFASKIKPLDDSIVELSFSIERSEGKKEKLGIKMYGVFNEHIISEYRGERNGEPDKEKVVKKFGDNDENN